MAAAPALAQQSPAPDQSMFARDRNVSVAERPHPGYDPLPVPVGAFTALPRLDAGIEYNDNIYAVQTGRKTDEVFTINPELDLSSNWSRNSLSGFARSASRIYDRYTSETSTDWQIGGQGRLDAGSGFLTAGGDTGELTEPRTSPNAVTGSVHPIRYQQSDGYFGAVEEMNRIRLTGRLDITSLDYHNGRDSHGLTVLEDDRDRTVYIYSAKAEYAISPDTSVYIDGSFNDHQYRLRPPSALVAIDRNSHGETFNVGASFDITHLIRGDVQVGYLKQDFTSHSFSSASGFGAQGRVEWFPTELTTVTLTGARQIQDAAASGSAAYLASNIGGQVDHELLRNLILTGRVAYEDDSYRGIVRDDHTTSAYVGARYLINRTVGVTVGYTYMDQTSSGAAAGPRFTDNKIMASANFRF